MTGQLMAERKSMKLQKHEIMYDVPKLKKTSVFLSFQEYLSCSILPRSKARRGRKRTIKFGNMKVMDKILTAAISLEYGE